MSYDLFIHRYAKGLIANKTNWHEIPDHVKESGEDCVFYGRSFARLWFERTKNLEEAIMRQISQEEVLVLLNGCKEALAKKEEVDKAVDEAVGDCIYRGRSEIDGHAALIVADEIMQKRIPKTVRMNKSEIFDWGIMLLRDFWWVYWDQLEKCVERLGGLVQDMDWDKEELFIFLN